MSDKIESPGAWVRRHREARGLSVRALAVKLGYGKTFVHDWETDTAKVSVRAVERLAELLGLPLIEVWRATHPGERHPFLAEAVGTGIREPGEAYLTPERTATDEELPSADAPLIRLPVFDAGAGQPSAWTDGGYPVGEASAHQAAPGPLSDANAFFVRIHGDSMSPTLEDGDLALVEPGVEPRDGKVCFATFPGEDGDRVVKRFRRLPDGTIHLESDNRDYPTLVLDQTTGRDVRIYRVTWLIRRGP